MSTQTAVPARRGGRSPDEAVADLQSLMAAARVSFVWFGTRKTLTPEQKAQAADAFGAEGQFLSAGKKLLDTRHERFRAVTAVRNEIVCYWRSISLPFPEPGIRLIKQESVNAFQEKMTQSKHSLDSAVMDLDRQYGSLKLAARQRLGRLFNPSDYPETLVGLFDVSWDFPSIEAPDYLRDLNPALYREECQRVQARFEEAVRMAESAFIEELARLVGHLTERLSGQEDGKPKIFRDSAVGNLLDFFEQFQNLNVRSNEQLDRLVEQCRQVVSGVQPQALRDSRSLRQQIARQLAGVQSTLDGMMVDRPRRRIIRPATTGAEHESRD